MIIQCAAFALTRSRASGGRESERKQFLKKKSREQIMSFDTIDNSNRPKEDKETGAK